MFDHLGGFAVRRGMWPIALVLGATALLVACGGGGSSSTPSTVAPTATPGVGTSPFAVSTTEPVSSAGTLTAPLTSPADNGTLTLVGVSSQVTSGVTLTVTLQNTPLAGFPTLESEARAAAARRSAAASAGADSLLYFEAEFSATLVATGGTLSLNVPTGALVSGDVYYLAFFDPNATSLGWQLDWSGPASVSGSTLTFALPAVTFRALTTYGFAIYGISSSATPPTPVPSPSPTATAASSASPSAPPTSSPAASAAPSASPTASASASPAASPTASPTISASPSASPSASASPSLAPSASPSPVPSPSPTASPSAAPGVLAANPTTVEIPGVGVADAQTVAVTESGYTGTFSQTNSCDTGTDIASFSATSAPGPSWNLVITGVSAGTCVATISDANGQSVVIDISVTSSGFTINTIHRRT